MTELNKSTTETIIENRIFIGGIPPHADENDFRTFLTSTFDKFMIKDVKIIFDRTGASKGYGFITFDNKDVAQKILTSPEFENLLYKERKLNISKAVKKNSYPKMHGSPATVMPNAGPVQYVLLQGQEPLGYAQSMLQLQHYGAYAPTFYLPSPYGPYATSAVAGGVQNGAGASSALVSQSSPHVQCQTIPWTAAAAAAAASLPGGHQALQFINPAGGAAPGTLACFGTGARNVTGATDLLYYTTPYNGSLTSDYSSCSDPNSSLDAGGTDSESSPARGGAAPGDCFSPGLALTYSPAQPLYQYAQMKGHQAQIAACLGAPPNQQQQQQQPQARLMMTAGGASAGGMGIGGRGDGRPGLKYMDHGGHVN